MATHTIQVETIDLANATAREYAALNDFQNALHAERVPDDPHIPLEERMNWWKNGPELRCHQQWIVWDDAGAAIIADAGATYWRTEENKHALDFGIGVLPEHRRQGIARRLLAEVADYAQQQKRPLLMVGTNDRVPGGEAFVKQLGAERGLETHTNQLAMEDLNRALVAEWIKRVPPSVRATLMWVFGKVPTPQTSSTPSPTCTA